MNTKINSNNGGIYSKLCAVMAECNAVAKARQGNDEGYKYNYRGVDDVMNELHPILAKNRLFLIPNILKRETEQLIEEKEYSGKTRQIVKFRTVVEMSYTFYDDEGGSLSFSVPGEGVDNGDKSINKALANALKYGLFQAFLIPTDEPKDAEKDQHAIKPKTATIDWHKLNTELNKCHNTSELGMLYDRYQEHHSSDRLRTLFSERKMKLQTQKQAAV